VEQEGEDASAASASGEVPRPAEQYLGKGSCIPYHTDWVVHANVDGHDIFIYVTYQIYHDYGIIMHAMFMGITIMHAVE